MKMLFYLMVTVLITINCISECQAQYDTITTVAGDGVGGYSGDSGLAVHAELNKPSNVAFDTSGNMYIADFWNNVVRKVNPVGIITTFAGNGITGYSGDGRHADSAELYNPFDVAIDKYGNIYISDVGNNVIRKVNTSGIISTFAGNGIQGFSGDDSLATLAELYGPGGVKTDDTGNVYIADEGNNRIRKVNISGIITTIAGNGTGGYSGDSGLATSASINEPYNMAIDSMGNIYIADLANYRIRKVNTSGIITTIAGNGLGTYSGDSGSAILAGFVPQGVAIDFIGNIYIDDYSNNRIRKVDTAGIIYTVAGNGVRGYCCDGEPADSAEFHWPTGVTINACGNIFIADQDNARIREVKLPPNPLTTTIIATPSDTVCASAAVTYSATVTGSGTLTYKWYVNGVTTSGTSSSYSYTPANGDSIKCVCIATSPCYGTDTVSSNTIHMVVQPYTTPTITVNAPVSAMLGSIVTVTATVAGAGSSYSIMWYDDGAWFATTTVPTTTYTKAYDVDTITATVASTSVGCWDSSTSNPFLIGDTSLGTSPCPLQRGNTGVRVFPNPASGVITITSAENIMSVEVRNVYGQVVTSALRTITSPLPPSKGEYRVDMDVSALPAGVYILCITQQPTLNPSEEGNSIMRQVVKE